MTTRTMVAPHIDINNYQIPSILFAKVVIAFINLRIVWWRANTQSDITQAAFWLINGVLFISSL